MTDTMTVLHQWNTVLELVLQDARSEDLLDNDEPQLPMSYPAQYEWLKMAWCWPAQSQDGWVLEPRASSSQDTWVQKIFGNTITRTEEDASMKNKTSMKTLSFLATPRMKRKWQFCCAANWRCWTSRSCQGRSLCSELHFPRSKLYFLCRQISYYYVPYDILHNIITLYQNNSPWKLLIFDRCRRYYALHCSYKVLLEATWNV